MARPGKWLSPDVKITLIPSLTDDDVALHAMGALRASVGAAEALPFLQDVELRHHGDNLGTVAAREIRKAEKAIQQKGV
jgi:hypothetical protein